MFLQLQPICLCVGVWKYKIRWFQCAVLFKMIFRLQFGSIVWSMFYNGLQKTCFSDSLIISTLYLGELRLTLLN